METIGIVQARTTSSRLPGKVLMTISGVPMIVYQLNRLKNCKSLDGLVMATSKEKEDDQLEEIVDAVGDKIDVICDGGIQRGTHVLKALSVGAKCCSGGKFYLYALGAGGQPAVEKALSNFRNEIERDMKLMGCSKISDLNRDNLRYREKYK